MADNRSVSCLICVWDADLESDRQKKTQLGRHETSNLYLLSQHGPVSAG